jgi:hypothetical protein
MTGLRKNTGAGFFRLFRGTLTTVAVASLALVSASAHASCFLNMKPGSAITMPMLQGGSEPLAAATTTAPSIVGLWGVIYTAANGAVFNQAFDTWHADGTEFENAYQPVLNGNICEGVWKSTGALTVSLHHIGWTYDPVAGGVANGTFTVVSNLTLGKDGKSYTGSFTFTAFDMKGKLLATVPGTIAAVRID